MTDSKYRVFRLCRYRRSLKTLAESGREKIFSEEIGRETGVSAAQVRKDFSIFGLSGNKKAGYQIASLTEKLDYILGKGESERVILVGVGNLGNALLKYKGFEKEDISIVAAFDKTVTIKSVNNIPVYDIKDLPEYIKANRISTAIIAVPSEEAQIVCDSLVYSGINGILNFSPVTLKIPESVSVDNVNLEIALENVIYNVRSRERKENRNYDLTQ